MADFSQTGYETLLYTLVERFPGVQVSTLRLTLNSKTTAIIRGSVFFENGLELRVFEYLDLSDGKIFEYSYTLYRGEQKIRWYDPQPHPDRPELAATFPHHYHEEPDPSTSSGQSIKHNRQPAPGITFNAPNLPALIEACRHLNEKTDKKPRR